MYSLDCIYVTSGTDPNLQKLVQDATDSLYAHCAIRIEIEGKRRIIEADAPAVHFAPGDEYAKCELKEIISLPINEEQRQAVIDRAFELVGKLYGGDDCIEGGLEDIGNRIEDGLGDTLAGLAHDVIGIKETYDCSHIVTELVRAAFTDFAQGLDGARITPEHSRKLVTELYNQLTQEKQ